MPKLHHLAILIAFLLPVGAAASTLTALNDVPAFGSVTGLVVATDDTPIAHAQVNFSGRGDAQTILTDAGGHFALPKVHAGTYAISVQAKGYTAISGRTLDVAADATTDVRLVMSTVQVSSLTVLGNVTINGSEALSSASAPSINISAQNAAAKGVTRVTDMATSIMGTTVVPVSGGGFNAPAAVALRSGEPGETLVEIDGHQVNNGSTGDFDLSLLDPADLQSVEIVYGIAPSSLVGPDTEGGAINIRTLEPTAAQHAMLRFTGSSYNTFGETLQATGTDDRVGYALSYHRVSSGGELDDFAVSDSGGGRAVVGDGLLASSALTKFRYSLGSSGAFVGVSFRDQAVFRDLSAALTSALDDGTFDSNPGTASLGHIAAYGLDLQTPIGRPDPSGQTTTTALFRHLTSLVSQSVVGPGVAATPYLYNSRDLIGDDTLEIARTFANSSLSLRFANRTESLLTDFAPGDANNDSGTRLPLSAGFSGMTGFTPDDEGDSSVTRQTFGQTQRSLGLRYSLDRTSALHYTLAAYYSDFSAAGHSIDPRLGVVWTPNAESALRVSIGETFQSPQLTSLFVPAQLPKPVNGYISVGNPNLVAERSTEYDVGYEHLFGAEQHQIHVAFDAYRTNIRDGISIFIPPVTCPPSDPSKNPACLSYPVNVANQVYTGFESHGDVKMGYHTTMHAAFGVESVYVKSVPLSTQDGTIVPFEQALGVPLHKASLAFEYDPSRSATYAAGVSYEGLYNELDRAPFATLNAQATWHLRGFDVGLYGTNLTGVYDDKFAREGDGVPYGGVGGPIATNALPLPGRVFTVSVTRRM